MGKSSVTKWWIFQLCLITGGPQYNQPGNGSCVPSKRHVHDLILARWCSLGSLVDLQLAQEFMVDTLWLFYTATENGQ